MLDPIADCMRFDARGPYQSSGFGLRNLRGPLLLWTFCAAAMELMTFGCAGPTANLVMVAPATAVAGSPFSVTVKAMVNGSPDTIFNTVIHFTSSDPAAVLPNDYVFTEGDAGSHTFTNGVTLITAGSQSVTATVPSSPVLTATAQVTVSSSPY